jgi:hypothetical protein
MHEVLRVVHKLPRGVWCWDTTLMAAAADRCRIVECAGRVRCRCTSKLWHAEQCCVVPAVHADTPQWVVLLTSVGVLAVLAASGASVSRSRDMLCCAVLCLQYMHIPDRDRCNWLRERIETPTLVRHWGLGSTSCVSCGMGVCDRFRRQWCHNISKMIENAPTGCVNALRHAGEVQGFGVWGCWLQRESGCRGRTLGTTSSTPVCGCDSNHHRGCRRKGLRRPYRA